MLDDCLCMIVSTVAVTGAMATSGVNAVGSLTVSLGGVNILSGLTMYLETLLRHVLMLLYAI